MTRRTMGTISALLVVLGLVVIVWALTRGGDPAPTRPGGGSTSVRPVNPTPVATQPTVGPLSGTDETPRSGLPTVRESELPREAGPVLAAIREGGPYDYPKDGTVFQNRERLLPSRPRGYYQEFTVRTPGESDRGARRIIAGRDGDLYWTADHYDSFEQILEGQ